MKLDSITGILKIAIIPDKAHSVSCFILATDKNVALNSLYTRTSFLYQY